MSLASVLSVWFFKNCTHFLSIAILFVSHTVIHFHIMKIAHIWRPQGLNSNKRHKSISVMQMRLKQKKKLPQGNLIHLNNNKKVKSEWERSSSRESSARLSSYVLSSQAVTSHYVILKVKLCIFHAFCLSAHATRWRFFYSRYNRWECIHHSSFKYVRAAVCLVVIISIFWCGGCGKKLLLYGTRLSLIWGLIF